MAPANNVMLLLAAVMTAASILPSTLALPTPETLRDDLHALALHTTTTTPPSLATEPFALDRVQLAPNTLFATVQQRNRQYQLALNSSQLLCFYTSAANLTRCSGSNCPSPGSTDPRDPVCTSLPGEMGRGAYYGHYLGHYLSGTAMMYNATGDAALRQKAADIVAQLADIQQAWLSRYGPLHAGYLFPYDPLVFDMLFTSFSSEPVYSVPFYTLHKVLAGLLDQFQLAGNTQALAVLRAGADWAVRHVQAVLANGGQARWQRILDTEWGGMNEVLYNLYAVTGEASYLTTAELFNHFQWTAPLAIGEDDLGGAFGNDGGNHANTHIPEVTGTARGYELTGNATQHAIVTNFFSILQANHTWATGGSNNHEHWFAPAMMGDQLDDDTQESCTSYNILKTAQHLFTWAPEASLADFFERLIFNSLVGNQNHVDDPTMTKFEYMLPLGGSGLKKPWGWSNESFPCCWGTLTEQYSKLPDSIYFQSADHATLYVNLFVSSSLHWAEQGLVVAQDAAFPVSTSATTTITIHTTSQRPARAGAVALMIRVPAWATQTSQNSVRVNGQPVALPSPGSFLKIERAFADGDTISVHFPLALWAQPVRDLRPAFNATLAWMYGPLLLAGVTPQNVFVPDGDAMQPDTFMTRNSSTALRFVARGQNASFAPAELALMPLLEIMDETYAVYFNTRAPSPVPYTPGGAMVPSAEPADYATSGGAGIVPSRMAGDSDVRSGDPQQTNTVRLIHPLLSAGHRLRRLSASVRYLSGYSPAPGVSSEGASFALELQDATGATVATVYQSQDLTDYPFDHYTRYSPPLLATSPGDLNISTSASEPLFVAFVFQDHDRNLQFHIDPQVGLNVTVEWW